MNAQRHPILYIGLLSDYPIATLQAILHVRPRRVLLVGSARMGDIAARVQRLLAARGYADDEVEIIGGPQEREPFPATSFHEAREWLRLRLAPARQRAEQENLAIIANITGSTKAAVLALSEVLDGCELHYTAEGSRNQLEALHHPERQLFSLPSLDELDELRLLNDEVRVRPDPWADIDTRRYAELIHRDVSAGEDSVLRRHDDGLRALWWPGRDAERRCAQHGIALVSATRARVCPGPLAELLAALAPLDPEACVRDETGLLIPRDREHRWCRFIISDWWEHLVAAWIADTGVTPRRNVELVPQRAAAGGTSLAREADVVFRTLDGELKVIECKVEPDRQRQLTNMSKVLMDLINAVGKTRACFALSPCFWWWVRSDSDRQAREAFEEACRVRGICWATEREEIQAWVGQAAQRQELPPYAPPPRRRSAEEILEEMGCLLLSWKEGSAWRLDALHAELARGWPQRLAEADALLAKQKQIAALLKRARQAGSQQKNALPALLTEADSLGVAGLSAKLLGEYERSRRIAAQCKLEQQRKAQGLPLSAVQPKAAPSMPVQPLPAAPPSLRAAPPPPAPLHPNDIRCLAPCPHWQLLIDESGSDFETASGRGRFVGLLVPAEGHGIAPLPEGWHACECEDPAEIDAAIQQVLDAPCGVIGFPVSALPPASGERWYDGVRAIVDWVLRLLPLDGPTRLEVLIEARPPFKPGALPPSLRRDVLALLARAWPQRAAEIGLSLAYVPKGEHPLLPHIDAIAFTWGSKLASARERLRRTQWLGSCLVSFPAEALAACWDAWDHPDGLPPRRWAELVASEDARKPASIASAILAATAEACRRDPRRWQAYLAEAQRQLGRSAIDLRCTAAMVEWLQRAQPPEAAIPPRLRLAWLTVSLAQANHLGATEHAWLDELTVLSARLQDEDAPLCCHADLHRAVAATNRFDFAAAQAAVAGWAEVPPAVIGLRRWGQLQSTIGQHHAFLGDPAAARAAFARAIAAFDRLSDAEERERERQQTLCYAAIAAMDDPALDDAAARAALEAYLGPLPDAATRLAAGGDEERYFQHTLLRFLVHRPDPSLAAAYLQARAAWQLGDGHPWPLIALYRGLLLAPSELEAARGWALEGHRIATAPEQGPTVRLIGAVCRAIAAAWGAPWPSAAPELAELRAALPAAVERLDRIEAFAAQPTAPLTLLRAVLPFNFR